MNGPLDTLLQGPLLETTLYPPGTRYNGVPLAQMDLADGRTARYLRRRVLPDPASLATMLEYRITDGDRVDLLAARFLGDALASWRIADANGALRIESLVEETGRRIRITLSEGVPGVSVA
jgi:hypothetical protein